MTIKGDKRRQAVDHAIRTTGTILVSEMGVFSGDGRRSFDPWKMYSIAGETKKFLQTQCVPFTREEKELAASRARHQEFRLQRLAKSAIDAGKYDAAAKLCKLASEAYGTFIEYESGTRSMYRIKVAA